MANNHLTIDMITKETLRVTHNEIKFAGTVDRQYDPQFAKSGAKIGSALRIRKPVKYTVTSGRALSIQDTEDQYTTLTVNTQKHVGMHFTADDLTLSIDEFSARYIKPAALRLASEIDKTGLELYYKIYQQVGTPGTTPATAQVFLDAAALLDDQTVPRDGNRYAALTPKAMARMVDALKGLYNDQSKVGKQYREGIIDATKTLGLNFFMTQNLARHTNGAQAGSPAVKGASQTGAALITNGWTVATTVKAGTTFTAPGVYSVNPETGVSTGELQVFTVLNDETADGSGDITLDISPSIVISGAYKTVTASPGNTDALTIKSGTASTDYPINLVYHKEAFTLAMADLEIPSGVDMASRAQYDGMSIRLVRDYDINNDRFVCRLDALWGWEALRPEFAVRVTG